MSPNVKESQLRLNLLTALEAASLEVVGLVKREAVLVMIHAGMPVSTDHGKWILTTFLESISHLLINKNIQYCDKLLEGQ